MTVTWFLEANVFAQSCFDQIVNHPRQHQIPHHVVPVTPFSHELFGDLSPVTNPRIVVADPVLPNGESRRTP